MIGHIENLLKRLNFEKTLCLKQRKKAALVAKFERSPANFKFVSSHPKIVFFEATFGQKWSKVRVAVVRKVVVRFWKSADFAKKYAIPVKIKEKSTENERFLCFLVGVFITDLILWRYAKRSKHIPEQLKKSVFIRLF